LFFQAVAFERPSKVLLTSRFELPGGARQKIPVRGMSREGFDAYTATYFDLYKIDAKQIEPGLMREFFSASDGSPIFAASIIKLVDDEGITLRDAVRKWKGSDGDAIRRYAFERDLQRLDERQRRVLYGLIALGEGTIDDVERLTGYNKSQTEECLASLRQYHLIATIENVVGSDHKYSIPESIRLMNGVVEQLLGIPDTRKLKNSAARIIRQASNVATQVATFYRDIYRRTWVGPWPQHADR
jgi:hypothetical protein